MLALLLVLLVVGSEVNASTFTGTTLYEFTCHCADGDEQCSETTGTCESGCDNQILSWYAWSGPGCQIGNIAYNKTATRYGHGLVYGTASADKAVDGDRARDVLHQSYSKSTGRWQLDLGSEHVIDTITLVTTTSETLLARVTEVFLSHTDDFYNPRNYDNLCDIRSINEVSGEITVECDEQTGRFILVRRSEGSSLLLAEVVVRGYEYFECQGQYEGNYHYGPGCLLNCHCEEQCDQITGVCLAACKSGYSGVRCQSCAEGLWGPDCTEVCHCNVACDSLTGYCSGKCETGYAGYNCQECDEDHWGHDCADECHCSEPCDKQTGFCAALCDGGFVGDYCEASCAVGKWGPSCINSCNCVRNGKCDGKTGACEGHCSNGYHVTADHVLSCKPCTYNKFGFNCEESCYCANKRPCDNVNGVCRQDRGCRPIFDGLRCNESCPRGETYGPNCMYFCDCEDCDYEYGCNWRCPLGYHGVNCHLSCADFTYGKECRGTCNCLDLEEVCDKQTGACQGGCAVDYFGPTCSDKLPDMGGVELSEFSKLSNGRATTVVYRTVRHALYYQIEYMDEAGEWIQATQQSNRDEDHLDEGQLIHIDLPTVRGNYTVRVVPYTRPVTGNDYVSIPGLASPEYTVYTECRDDWYGDDCQYQCECSDATVTCYTDTGECGRQRSWGASPTSNSFLLVLGAAAATTAVMSVM